MTSSRLIYPEIPPAGPSNSNDGLSDRSRFETKVMDYLKFTIYDPNKQSPYNYIKDRKKSQGSGEWSFNSKVNTKFQGNRVTGDNTTGIWRTVYLYLPHQLNEQYSTNYNRSALGPFGNSLLAGAQWAEDNIMGGEGGGKEIGDGGLSTALLQAGAKTRGKQAVFQAITGAFNGASALTGGSLADKDALSALQNKAVFNPYEETTFKGVRYRSHSFNFDMAPRNTSEVNQIQNIIYTLRSAMLPTKTGENDEWLTIPKFFKTDIVRFEPRKLEDESAGFNKPSTLSMIMQFPVKMVLTDMQLNLTPNGQNTSLKASGDNKTKDWGPASYKMTLRFDETAFITNDLLLDPVAAGTSRESKAAWEEKERQELARKAAIAAEKAKEGKKVNRRGRKIN